MFQWLRSLIFTVQMYLMMAVIGIGMLPLALLLSLGHVDSGMDGWH
jgi:hypothetical protein